MLQLLLDFGYWGMLVAAFLAGSFIPYSSEAVMIALQAAGLDAVTLVIYASIGNTLGSIFNYYMGRFAGAQWVVKYLHVKQQSLDRAKLYVKGHGAWVSFFAFIPIIGSAISIALGMMRANQWITFGGFAIGKIIRYIFLAITASFFL
ncbi:MAG: DedA family protein [Prevotella sp.]|nr:DedA family protein [Candidatus Equicola faecalis]